MDYAHNRYHNPGTGRFLTADPFRASARPVDPTSWNRYAYTHGDPINRVDRSGLVEGDDGCDPDEDDCVQGNGDGGGGGGCAGDGFLSSGSTECTDPDGGGGTSCGPGTHDDGNGNCVKDPTCEDMLVDEISSFLSKRNPSLAMYASAFEAAGASYDIDPRLFAAMAIAENGQATNNPFGLGPNGSSKFGSMGQALAQLGRTLDKYIYTWHETTVSILWSGNTWQVDPKKKWVTIQYPGYCVGTTDQDKAGCQKTGQNISTFMKSMIADPNNLAFPCPELE